MSPLGKRDGTEAIVTVEGPGVWDLTADEYHADPVPGGSLSSTAVRRLLDCPARYKAYVDGEEERSSASASLDFGKLAHARVLGTGPDLYVSDADGRTKAGAQAREEAAELGAILVKSEAADRIERMAAALQDHPIASRLLDPGMCYTEQTLVWRDQRTGVMRRAMLDVLPHWAQSSGLFLVADFKTSRSANPRKFEKSMWDFGYHIQGEWYLDGIRALGLAGDAIPTFVFIVQETHAPFVVSVVQYGETERYWAATQIRAAIDTWKRCTDAGRWPGYTDEIAPIQLPVYATRQLEDQQEAGLLPKLFDHDLRSAS